MIFRTIAYSLFIIILLCSYFKNRKSKFIIWFLFAIFAVNTVAMIIGDSMLNILPKVIGEYFLVCGAFLALSSFAIKEIYKYSRNPDFLGLILGLTGMCLVYATTWLIGFDAVAIAIIHIYVIVKERKEKKGSKAWRFFGRGRITYRKLKCMIYLLGLIWCMLYTITLLIYTGPFLSWLWLWPLGMVFCFIRFLMIFRNIRVPKPIAIPYHIMFPIFFIFFVVIELMIIQNKFHIPSKELDYVIVLGAGVNGYSPSKPLKERIDRAYNYLEANPNTIAIASGGQGSDELISEAQCIKNRLVAMGIEEDRIIIEDRSTSTEENLAYSYQLIDNKNASVGIITNSFHEFRAKLMAYRAGFGTIESVPARTLYPVGIHYTVREFFGVVKFFIS